MRVWVERWAAWAPGVEDASAWEAWSRRPGPLPCEGSPDVPSVPPLLRRRCGRVARMALRAALDCCGEDAGGLPTVFASRSGEIEETVALLRCLAERRPLTAARFSHSVHNTPPGLLSIVTGSRHGASAVAGGRDTFASGFLEAVGLLARDPGPGVLLVAADEPIPQVFRRFADEPPGLFAVALHLVRPAGPRALHFGLDGPGGAPAPAALPPPVEFLRWLLSEEPALTLRGARGSWTWRRADGSGAAPPPEDE